MTFESGEQEAQAALDHFGFLVISYTHQEDAERDMQHGFTSGKTFSKDHGMIPLHAVVIDYATLEDWRAQERFYGDTPVHMYHAFLKVVAE